MQDGKHSIRYQRMSLETLMDELMSTGFILERLVEPRPVEALREINREADDDLAPEAVPPSTRLPPLLKTLRCHLALLRTPAAGTST